MKFNINDKATVRLTDHGRSVLRARYEEIGVADMAFVKEQLANEGPIEFTLWELMQTFGDCLHMGAPAVPFVGNEIDLEVRP